MTASILIPCHNAALHLAQCLESAIAQGADEILLLDDGSTDDSLAIARSYPAVTVFSQAQQGAQATRNELFRRASGGWIQYLDADDYLLPGKIEQQIAQLSDAQIGYCDFRIDRDGVLTDFISQRSMLESLRWWEYITQTNALLLPRVAMATVTWDESCLAYQPHRLIFDLLRAGYDFRRTPFFGSVYRQDWQEDQLSQQTSKRLAAKESLLQAMDAAGGRFAIPEQTWKRLAIEKEITRATVTS